MIRIFQETIKIIFVSVVLTIQSLAQSDTITIKNYLAQVDKNLEINLDSSIYYLDKANTLISMKQHPKFYFHALVREATIYTKKGNTEKSIKTFEQALEICEIHNFIKHKPLIIRKIGIDYKNDRKHNIAERYFREALEIAEELSDSLMISELIFSYATLYQADMQYEKAIEYYLRCIEIDQALGIEDYLGSNYMNVAIIFEKLNEIEKATNNYHIAIELHKKHDNKIGLIISYLNLGSLFFETKMYQEALIYLNRSDKSYVIYEIRYKRLFSSDIFVSV
jgi:tetratricopeptide (TPR) repeat protein